MELNTVEMKVVADLVKKTEGEVEQLDQLQLALIGGGCADPAFI